jgi:hypothetical protein
LTATQAGDIKLAGGKAKLISLNNPPPAPKYMKTGTKVTLIVTLLVFSIGGFAFWIGKALH